MTEASIAKLAADHPAELASGFYKPGRWAWVLGDIRPLERPYRLGGQRWPADIEPDHIEQIRRLAIEPTGATS
jgi:hypothetical protein